MNAHRTIPAATVEAHRVNELAKAEARRFGSLEVAAAVEARRAHVASLGSGKKLFTAPTTLPEPRGEETDPAFGPNSLRYWGRI